MQAIQISVEAVDGTKHLFSYFGSGVNRLFGQWLEALDKALRTYHQRMLVPSGGDVWVVQSCSVSNRESNRPQSLYNGAALDRGATVLSVGIFAIVGSCLCLGAILGPVACLMAAWDLRRMQAGRLDPAGRSLTRAGLACGIVATIVSLAGFLFAQTFK